MDTNSTSSEIVLNVENLSVYYGDFLAVKDVTMSIPRNKVTAFIGPSGCGKSTFIRCLNRMNDLIPTAKVEGKVIFENEDIYDDDVDATEIRSRIGMVFQKPNPFPKSIYQNIAFGLKVNGFAGDMDQAVENPSNKQLSGKKLKIGLMIVHLLYQEVNSRDCVLRGHWL